MKIRVIKSKYNSRKHFGEVQTRIEKGEEHCVICEGDDVKHIVSFSMCGEQYNVPGAACTNLIETTEVTQRICCPECKGI